MEEGEHGSAWGREGPGSSWVQVVGLYTWANQEEHQTHVVVAQEDLAG